MTVLEIGSFVTIVPFLVLVVPKVLKYHALEAAHPFPKCPMQYVASTTARITSPMLPAVLSAPPHWILPSVPY